MHITDIMRGESPTFSFEFFPPKTQAAAESLYQTIRELEEYMPHFVSVTYGAGGSTRDLTHDLVERIQNTTKLDPIPHLTCVCHTEAEIDTIVRRYAKSCIGNILALGGDPPRGCAYDKSKDAFQNAADLVKFIRRFNESGLHRHPALFRKPRLLRFPRTLRACRDSHPDHRGHHADHVDERMQADRRAGRRRAVPGETASRPPALRDRSENGRARRRSLRPRAMPRPPRQPRGRHSFLHAQQV
jgi:Methylenetetrahydrofolate reductase